MKIKECEKNNYDEEYIIKTIIRDLKRIEEDVNEYHEIHGSTVKTAELLYRNLEFFKKEVLEDK